MDGSKIQEKAIEVVVIMNTAIINLRLYPPTNAMVVKTIDRLYDMLQAIFAEEGDLLLAESGKNLLISGDPLSQKNQERPQVAIFLLLMINWGIKSIGFNKNMDKIELSFFLEIMGKKPEDVKKDMEMGLEQLISEGKMPHIQINQKVYVEMDSDRQIVAGLDIKDEDIIKYITNEVPDIILDPAEIKEKAQNPEWVLQIFQSGLKHLSEKDGTLSDIVLSENMIHMLHSLDNVMGDADKNRISQQIATTISDMDADLVATILTKNMDGLLENSLFDHIIDRIDHEKFEHVAGALHHALDGAHIEGREPDREKIESVQQAYQHLMNTDKGVELQHQIEEKHAREKEEKENRIREVKGKVLDFLNQLDEGMAHKSDATSLPEMLDMLYSEGETETAEAIIDRLTGSLQSDHSDIRAAASGALVNIIQNFSEVRRTDILNRYLDRLLSWIRMETLPSHAFGTICTQLKDMAQGRIRKNQCADSLPILEALYFIASRQIEKDDQIQSTAADTLGEIASADILEVLLAEFRTDIGNQRNEAGRNLVLVAEHSINSLLDLLQESESSTERVLILNLIPEMGHIAAPYIIGRIEESAPWYYLRNLALLLGRIGSEEHAQILAPLLVYDDPRVQREALKSVNNIGGAFKGEILLNALSGCDDQLKASVVTTLGSLKHRDALKSIVELFKSKLNLSEEMKVNLQENICRALGKIGDREALPFLTEVSKSGGIFGFKSYNPKVKAAAGRAVGMLSKI
ncbi:MAG: HEAT repeat domain-containing protein [Syntrophales bacterium]